jgi:hypothetical protein
MLDAIIVKIKKIYIKPRVRFYHWSTLKIQKLIIKRKIVNFF